MARLFNLGISHSSEELQISVREWLQMQESDSYRDAYWKLVSRWQKCVIVLGDYAANPGHETGINELHLMLFYLGKLSYWTVLM